MVQSVFWFDEPIFNGFLVLQSKITLNVLYKEKLKF